MPKHNISKKGFNKTQNFSQTEIEKLLSEEIVSIEEVNILNSRDKKLNDNRMTEILEIIKKEDEMYERECNRQILAKKIWDNIFNKISNTSEYTNKIYNYGEAITYLDVIQHNIKIGRVKIAQGRNSAITLCFERFDHNGSRYIKLYTHHQLMKRKASQDNIINNFSEVIFNKYINI